jgi:YVTN family beta-propeller protein
MTACAARTAIAGLTLVGTLGSAELALAAKRAKLPTRSTTIALFRNDGRLAVVNRDADSLTVLQVRRNRADVEEKLAEVTVGHEPRCVAIGAKEKEAFVVNSASGTVSVVALKGPRAHEVVAEFPVGPEPRGCAMSPNGKRLFVASYTGGTVAVVDPAARSVVATVPVGGTPFAIAVTNDGDKDDADETVFVTQFFAELVPDGPGESFDDGKQGVVQAFPAGALTPVTKIVLAPLADSGFTADRTKFCRDPQDPAINPNLQSEIFCPAPGSPLTAASITKDPQGAYPNQLQALLVRSGQVLVPSIGAAPEPPVKFNVNVQGLVHVIDRATAANVPALTTNLNAQIKAETQPDPAQGSLARAFVNDLVALDATADGGTVLFVSRGGNYVLRAARDANGALSIGAPDAVVRFQTGNLPTGVVISRDGTRAYVSNEIGLSVSVLDLVANTVRTRDLATATPPPPGTFEHALLVGKLVFHTAFGVPDSGLFGKELRDIVPVDDRNKASDNGWSSCASCHPDGLADGVTWIFATGPRQTLPLDGFFSKRNPADQKISNYSGVMGSITDFNNNSRGVQGGQGFVTDPALVFQHGPTQGVSEALDAETLWVQSIRPLARPKVGGIQAGSIVFEAECASCHGGAKWTKSQTIYLNNPTLTADVTKGGVPLDPGLTMAGAQVRTYENAVAGVLSFLDPAGTFDPTNPREIRNDGTLALGGLGFNVPSLLGIGHHAPYFHDGSAPALEDVFDRHALPTGKTIAATLSAAESAALRDFLLSIDGTTPTFASDTDGFLDRLTP